MKLSSTTKRILLLSCIVVFAVTMSGCRVPVDEAGQIKLIYPDTTFNEIMDSESWFGATLVWPLAQALNKLTPTLGVGGAIGQQFGGLTQNMNTAETKECPKCKIRIGINLSYCACYT